MRCHGLCLVLLLLAGPPGRGQKTTSDTRAALASLQARDAEEVAAELAQAGPALAPELLLLLDAVAEGDSQASEALTPLERQVVLRSLELVGRATVLSLVERELASPTSAMTAHTAVEVIGIVGRADDLNRATEIASPASHSLPVSRPAAAALQESCRRICDRDARGFRVARSLVPGAHSELRAALLSGMALTGRRQALPSLAGLLGLMPELDAELLTAIAIVAHGLPQPFASELRGEVRPYLWEVDSSTRREAVLAVGALHDTDAVARLIQMLSQDRDVPPAAMTQSLREITGASFTESPQRWKTWYVAQKSWYKNRAPALVELLEDGTAPEVGSALNELVQHALFHEELVEQVIHVLDHEDPRLRAKTCDVLAVIGSLAEVPRLAEMLDDSEEDVARAAHRALVSLTGLPLTAEPSDWADALRRLRDEA